ncbi:MAG: hypothetical protein ACXAC6_02430 [Candidatus Hodarchaeales archaeon]
MSEQSQKSFFSKKIEEIYDDFTRKMFEDYYLILKDGRIVGSRPPTDTDVSLSIKFEVVGMYCNSAGDVGWSPAFSPRGLDCDLYFTTKELSTILDIVPNQEHLIIALPIFMDDNKKPLHNEIIAFRPAEKIEGEDKHLLLIYAPYLIQLFSNGIAHNGKAKSFRLRNYKYAQCRILKEDYDYPPDMEDENSTYSHNIGGWMNFFEVVDKTDPLLGFGPSGDWKTLLMCTICGKFYLSKKPLNFAYETGVGCPVCLESYPEEEPEKSVRDSDGPWFQSFIPEYPLDRKK